MESVLSFVMVFAFILKNEKKCWKEMKLTKNEIKTLEWHLRRYLKGHQPDHPRENEHYKYFYRTDKLEEIYKRLKDQ